MPVTIEHAPDTLCGSHVPGCDHGVPPDVSWENYLYYREVLLNVKL